MTKLDLFPENIIDEYNLKHIVDANGNIYCEVRRGNAHRGLVQRINEAGMFALQRPCACMSRAVASTPLAAWQVGAKTGTV